MGRIPALDTSTPEKAIRIQGVERPRCCLVFACAFFFLGWFGFRSVCSGVSFGGGVSVVFGLRVVVVAVVSAVVLWFGGVGVLFGPWCGGGVRAVGVFGGWFSGSRSACGVL